MSRIERLSLLSQQTLPDLLVSQLIESLTPEASSPEQTGAIEWTPQVGPQTTAFESTADVIGYGGSAGGGKTDLLLGHALFKHQKSVIFRREAKQLREIIERSVQLIGGLGRFNENLLVWRDLPGGRLLELGGVKDQKDVKKWRGRAHDLKAFDEVTEFSEAQFRFLIAWNRTTVPGLHCQVVAAFNPPTDADGAWVISYWAPWLDPHYPNPAKPGELRWFARIDNKDVEVESGEPFEHHGERIQPKSRTFIPATLDDNAYLRDTDYRATLQALPEPLRSQLLLADFQAGLEDDAYQVIPTAWVKLAQARWKADGRPRDEQGRLTAMSALGVDVARGGDDKTVLAPRYDNWFDQVQAHPGKTTPSGPHVVRLIIQLLETRGEAVRAGSEITYSDYGFALPLVTSSTRVNVDVIGVGSGTYDIARTHKLRAEGINVSESSKARTKDGRYGFVNKRAELMWKFREALDPATGENLALPPDSELLADLCTARYSVHSNGIKIESKDEIKKRIGRSPDKGDGVILAHANTKLQLWV